MFLSVFFYNHKIVKLTVMKSVNLAIKEVLHFGKKAQVLTCRIDNCVSKLLKLHKNWKSLRKSSNRTTSKEIEKRATFVQMLDNLFDIAASDAINHFKGYTRKQILSTQSQKERVGEPLAVEEPLPGSEPLAEHSNSNNLRLYEDMEIVPHSTSSSEMDERGKLISTPTAKTVYIKRGCEQFFNPRLLEVFDRCKISDRNGVYILMAAAESFGQNVENLVLNRSSIYRLRKKFRNERHTEIQKNFKLATCEKLVVHWDGKLLPQLTGIGKIDRLAILVTFQGMEQLLGVPDIESSSGADQGEAIFEAVEEWGVTNKVQALCFDTTASNTGRLHGACVNMEKF